MGYVLRVSYGPRFRALLGDGLLNSAGPIPPCKFLGSLNCPQAYELGHQVETMCLVSLANQNFMFPSKILLSVVSQIFKEKSTTRGKELVAKRAKTEE